MDTMKPLRCGVLGTGWVLGKYAEAFRLIDSVSLVGVASHDPDRAKTAASKWGIPRAHGSYESLVSDPDIDIVINALHNGLHCEWTIRALQAGKHVLCEKPLACSSDEVERMFAAAHAHERWLMEGFMYRFHPQMTEARHRVDRGDIGRVLYIHSHRTAHGRPRDNPRYWRDAGGGALLDIGCYNVNVSRMFAGSEPLRVAAHAHFDSETGVDLTLTGTLIFECKTPKPQQEGSGVAALLRSAESPGTSNSPRFIHPESFQGREARLQHQQEIRPPETLTAHFVCSMEAEPSYAVEIVGTEGRLQIPHPWMPPFWPTELNITRSGNTETVRVGFPDTLQNVLAPFALEVQYFSRCVGENRPPQFPPDCDAEQDSRANARVLDALAASARSGQPVEIKPFPTQKS
jgi:predicted dehydrogenase